MSRAPDRTALKKRLDRFFWENRSGEMRLLRSFLERDLRPLGDAAVVGGLVRDFARGGREAFASDVDIVIDARAGAVSDLARRLSAQANRFGGFGCRVGPWRVDFWALETTWAARCGGAKADHLSDLVGCTFFDWDGALYRLWDRQLVAPGDYLDRIASSVLDVRFRPTPSPEGNLLRAIRRLVLWNARAGDHLRLFVEEHLDDATFALLKLREEALPLPGERVTARWADAAAARSALLGVQPGACDSDPAAPELPGIARDLHPHPAPRVVPSRASARHNPRGDQFNLSV